MMSRVIFFAGSGSQECAILGPAKQLDEWAAIKGHAIRLLRARGMNEAAEAFENDPSTLFHATNSFEDEFLALDRQMEMEDFIQSEELVRDPNVKRNYRLIAQVLQDMGHYVRFIVGTLDTSGGPKVVQLPEIKMTSAAALAALEDARQLILSNRAEHAVDRVHTVMHGYLIELCRRESIQTPSEKPSLMELYKNLREQHPVLSSIMNASEEVRKMLRTQATVLESLNTLRNHFSPAHPNEHLLDEAEAYLAVNAAHTLIHYLHAKLG